MMCGADARPVIFSWWFVPAHLRITTRTASETSHDEERQSSRWGETAQRHVYEEYQRRGPSDTERGKSAHGAEAEGTRRERSTFVRCSPTHAL